ncbi:thyroid receptor-interacting protein 11-like [Ursus maritimus]|uniref:Thyroid receptor-interacting protein 11-like n=1 Tax=Ursus maritimus TaxID=29073 RepID=A0A8M1GL91_URSMA|nr:thyroid receptor-interacting protein 11-like [Ursus maritimus]
MLPWVGGLGSGLDHSPGEVDGREPCFTSHIDFTGHVGKGTSTGEEMDFADLITSQAQINRLLKDIETLEAEVSHWRRLSQSSSKILDSSEIWKLKTTIRDLEQQRMKKLDEHQLEVSVLQSLHKKQLADVIERHRQQLREYEQRESELGRVEQQLAEMERLNDNLNNVASDVRAENQKLVLALQDVRHQLEESILRNNEECLENNIAVRALKIEKGRLVAKLYRTEKKALEEKRKYKQTIKKLLPLEHARLIRLMQEKDLELFHLQKKIEQMDADHRETKDMLSSALEEQKQLTQVIKEKASRSNDLLEQTVEDKDMRLTSVTAENHHLKEELERLRQQSRPVPDPKILELECEVFQLNELKDDLEEEVKEQQKIIHNQQQGKIRLLQSLQEQKQKVDHLQSQQEQLHIERAQLLAAKDQEIQNLQDTLGQMKAQLPDKSQHIAAEHCDDVQVTSSQPLPRENGSEKLDPSKGETQRSVQGIKEQEVEMKLLTEQNIRLTEHIDRVSKEEIGKLTQIIQQKDLEIEGLSSRISAASQRQRVDVERLQQQLQECASKSDQVLAVLNEKTRENSHLTREYQKMTERLAAKEAELQRMQEENRKLSPRIECSGQEMFRETIQNLSHIIREKDLEVDALSQKCQTLLTILQTSSTGDEVRGVHIDQFKELLRERDTFKQRVKIMEEWKEQVMTTVQNMKQESPQLQSDLRQLQAQACPGSEEDSKLQATSMDLIQTYRGKEITLEHLEKDLARIQLSIGENCHAKDLLLGKLDAIFLQPSPDSSEPADSLKAVTSDVVSQSSQLRQEEVEELRKSMQEKDTMIRTLQEEKQRWMDSVSAASPGEGKQQEHGDSDMEPLKEKQAVLQNFIPDQELRLQAKSEELLSLQEKFSSQVSENDLLRQAVTDLKERLADFETDVCQLKEENAKLVETCREKEMENQALQETNRRLSMLPREEESQSAAVEEKALALEQVLRGKEEGETGEAKRLVDAVASVQDQTVVCPQEREEVLLALTQKQMETCALQKEVHHLRERESRLTQELERRRHVASEAEDSRRREALVSEGKVAQLREEVTVLQGKLVLSSTALENASHRASVQVQSLREQLHVVTQQKEEAAFQLAASQEEGRQYGHVLAALKLELAEWMEKADSLEGKLKSLQGRFQKAKADLGLKEDQLQEVKKQNEVQQEVLEDTQKKLMDLVSKSEGMVDKTLLRRLFVGSLQAPDADRQEALRLMAGTLGIQEDQMRQLFSERPGGVTSWVTGGPGSRSAPNTPGKPSHRAMANNSFSGLFVQFLEAESHSASPPPKPSAHDVKPPDSGGRGKVAKKQGPQHLNTALGSTPRKKDVKPRTTAVSLITPPGPETDGSEHLLLNAVTDAFPTYTPQILSPATKVGMAATGPSKK